MEAIEVAEKNENHRTTLGGLEPLLSSCLTALSLRKLPARWWGSSNSSRAVKDCLCYNTQDDKIHERWLALQQCGEKRMDVGDTQVKKDPRPQEQLPLDDVISAQIGSAKMARYNTGAFLRSPIRCLIQTTARFRSKHTRIMSYHNQHLIHEADRHPRETLNEAPRTGRDKVEVAQTRPLLQPVIF